MREVPFPDTYKTMGIGFLSDGRMVLATTEEIGWGEVPRASTAHKLYIVSSPGSESGSAIKVKEIANNWKQMIGVTVVNDTVYVSERDSYRLPAIFANWLMNDSPDLVPIYEACASASSGPRKAAITFGIWRTTSGVPSAITSP